MINEKSVETFKADTLAMAFSDIEKNDRYTKCGRGKGRGFEFNDGDVIKFPELDQLFIKVETTTLNKENYDLLYVGCEVNGSPKWVPVWALRKSVAADKEPVKLKDMAFYQEILKEVNDIARIKRFIGLTLKVAQFTIKLVDSKTKQEFNKKVWAYTVVEAPKKGKGKKRA